MVNEQSNTNDNNLNNSMNETAGQDEFMMEVDGQAENGSGVEPNETLDHSVGEENDANHTKEKIREYYLRATYAADSSDAGATVDTVIIFDTLEAADTADTDETPDTAERSDFVSRVIDDYLETHDFNPILMLTQEQLLIDWLTSRHLLTKNDFDE